MPHSAYCQLILSSARLSSAFGSWQGWQWNSYTQNTNTAPQHPSILSPQHNSYFALHLSGCCTSRKIIACVFTRSNPFRKVSSKICEAALLTLTSLPWIRERYRQYLSQKPSITTALLTHLTWRASCSQEEDRWLWFDVCSQTFLEKTSWQWNSCFLCWNVNKLVQRINETAIILTMHWKSQPRWPLHNVSKPWDLQELKRKR